MGRDGGREGARGGGAAGGSQREGARGRPGGRQRACLGQRCLRVPPPLNGTHRCVCSWPTGPLTGCGINPARVIGAVVWEDEDWWKGRTGKAFWIYIAGPLVAALLGPLTHAVLYGTVSPGTAGKKASGGATDKADKEDLANKVMPLES